MIGYIIKQNKLHAVLCFIIICDKNKLLTVFVTLGSIMGVPAPSGDMIDKMRHRKE